MRMSLYKVMTILAALLLTTGVMAANETKDAREVDHAALRVLMTDTVEAINGQDMDALAACFTDDFVFTTIDQTVLATPEEIKDYYERMLNNEESPISGFSMTPSPDIPTVFLDDQTGFCYGTSDDAYTLRKNKRVIHMTSKWTATVVKVDGQWKIATAHSGVDVMDNPLIKIKTLSWWRRFLLAIGIGKYPGEK